MIKEVKVLYSKCENCGKVVDEVDSFCYSCGNDLRVDIQYKEISNSSVFRLG